MLKAWVTHKSLLSEGPPLEALIYWLQTASWLPPAFGLSQVKALKETARFGAQTQADLSQ